jgi:hypothetical protein
MPGVSRRPPRSGAIAFFPVPSGGATPAEPQSCLRRRVSVASRRWRAAPAMLPLAGELGAAPRACRERSRHMGAVV